MKSASPIDQTRAAGLESHTRRIGFVSLGCPKALVDSEQILSRLRAEGYQLSPGYEDADLVVVNTCGFITPAVEESLDAIGEALAGNGKVVVTGCLGERPETIIARHPEVLAVTGQADVEGVMSAVRRAVPLPDTPFTSLLPQAAVRLTPRHYAYLKIAEGCDHRCSFCIIPKLRGNLRSRPAADLLFEARRLVASGVKELLLIAQDSSAYGNDIRHAPSDYLGREVRAHLCDLVEELADLGVWLRLHYVYPYPHVQDLMPLMAEGKLLPYLDVPLQHASPRILRAMRRPGGAISHLETIRRWREVCPELVVRSTFIVGFPGETDAEFQELLDFLAEARLDRVGAFTYSEVPEADANDLPGAVPQEVKEERYAALMQLQAQISAEKLAARVGSEIEVLVDDYGDLPGDLIARSHADSPGIDGLVYASGDGTYKIGDMLRVKVTSSTDHDLFGEVVGATTRRVAVPAWG